MVKTKKFVEKKVYSQLSESSKKSLATVLEKVHKSGYSVRELLNMKDSDFRKRYGTTAKDLNAQKRRLKQVIGSNERKSQNVNRVLDSYKKQGFRGKRFDQIKREVNKTAGNTFDAVVSDVKDKYIISNNQKAYAYARDLLKVPANQIQDLNPTDQEIISGYDTSP